MPESPGFDPLALPAGALIEEFRRSTGFTVTELSGERVRATMSLQDDHHQPFGVVHGGVYAMAVEGVASYGATLAVFDQGMYAVGVNNNTDFLRPVIAGEVEVVGEPVLQEGPQQLWRV
jgi:uncharacterized protein (TIGR00369 family)